MKICFIANPDSIHTRRWAQPILERGDQVTVLTYLQPVHPWPEVEIIDLTRLNNQRKARFVRWGLWLRSYLRASRPDILHAHQVTPSGWLAALSGYHPLVAMAWGSDLLEEPHRSAWRRRLVQMALRRSDRLVAPSALLHQAARSLGMPEERIVDIPWGVESDLFYPDASRRAQKRAALGLSVHEWLFFCPRGLQAIYHTSEILQAVRLVHQQLPTIRLLLLDYIPDPDYAQLIRRQIQQWELQSVVSLLPPVALPDMADLYRAADAVISIPSSEGFGFSVYEAMACGCPTIISDTAAFHHLHDGRQTLKVRASSPAALAHAMLTIVQDTTLRQTLQDAGAAYGLQHNILERRQKTFALYDSLSQEAR